MVTLDDLKNWFTYHAPNEAQLEHYHAIRDAAFDFAAVILAHTLSGADQTSALRKIREAVMTANASIACGGE